MTPDSPILRARRLLASHGIARARDLEAAGVSRTQIRRLLDQGLVERVGRGLYRDPAAPSSERSDLAHAARLVPSGVVCLLSALRFHDLTTQNPFGVWMAIERNAWRPRPEHPPLRLVFLSGPALNAEVEQHEVDGVLVQVFSAAKTVADCFKFRHKIGIDVALEALRAYRRAHPKQMEAVWRSAELDRVTRVIRPYLEALG